MPRKRVLDPSIWTDDGMAELTARQQLLYIGLISNADDEGRQKASPVAIRLSLPTVYANVLDGEIDADLTAVLRRMRQLVAYIADERRYLVFLNYRKWQRIDRPSPSNLPPPPQPCANDRRAFDESSTSVRPELRELKEVNEMNEEKERASAPQDTPADIPVIESISEITSDRPYGMVAMLCEENGREIGAMPADWRSKQLAIAKRLLENHSIEQVRIYVRYRRTEWNGATPFDLRHVEKDIGAWELAGSPSRASPTAHGKGGNGRATTIERPTTVTVNGEEVSDERRQYVEGIAERARAARAAAHGG